MNRLLFLLNEHPRLTAFFGTATGWFSVDTLAHAKDTAQLFAAIVAGLVSLCALILSAPKAVAEVSRWLAVLRRR